MEFPADRSARSVARSLGRLSSRWLDPKDAYRRKALRAIAGDFPGKMGEALVDALFSELREKNLTALLKKNPGPFRAARGRLVVHVVPANVPNPAVTSLVLGLLAGAANAVKVSKDDPGLLRVYVASLCAHEPALGRAVEVVTSHPDTLSRLKKASLVVAYGSDETVARLRKRAPKKARFLGYGHRVSVGIFAKESLGKRLARAAARDAWMMDRRGCMSPDVFFVEEGGAMTADAFAAALASELEKAHAGEAVSFARALRLKAARDRERLRAAKGETVGPRVPVRIFRGTADLERALARYRGKLQVAALEGPPAFRRRLLRTLRRLGATRVCRAGRMQRPPLAWDHQKRGVIQ